MFANRIRCAAAGGVLGGVALTELFHKIRESPSKIRAAELIVADNQKTALSRPSEIMRHGFPGTDNIRYFSDYVLSYDKRNRTANWVVEHMTADSLKKNKNVDRSKCDFKEDPFVHPYFRSRNEDYRKSGFDRGHLAAAGNHHKDQQLVDETFFLSNMSPQVGKGFNRDSWNRLEVHMRKLTLKYKNVHVCTGPLYLPRREADGNLYVHYRVIGANNVAVPTHFFKVALCEDSSGQIDLEAYIMPNAIIDDNTPLQAFQVPLDSIERAAGLLIFDRIDTVRSVNGRPPPKQLRPVLKLPQ